MFFKFRQSTIEEVKTSCPGFFLDSRHFASQFEFMTKSSSRDEPINNNFRAQMDLMKKLVEHEFRDDVATLELVRQAGVSCGIERGGNRTLQDIRILRLTGNLLDKSGAELFRLKEDKSPESKQPYIACIEDEDRKTFTFNIVVERKPLIEGLGDIQAAISCFIHVVFIFNLKFPKGEKGPSICTRFLYKPF